MMAATVLLLATTIGATVLEVSAARQQRRAVQVEAQRYDRALGATVLSTLVERLSELPATEEGGSRAARPLDRDRVAELARSAGLDAAETLLLQGALGGQPGLTLAALKVRLRGAAEAARSTIGFPVPPRRSFILPLLACMMLCVAAGVFMIWYALDHAEVLRGQHRARRSVIDAQRETANILTRAGHDLQQPLRAIGLFASTLASHPLEARSSSAAKQIEAAAQSMQRMITGLLDVAKLDAGLVGTDFAMVRLADLFEMLRQEFAQSTRAKELCVLVRPTAAVVHTDPLIIETILRNLIGNAVRYTARGSIEIGADPDGATTVVSVGDTGVGIPPEALPFIFDDFFTQGTGGSGLGLGLGIVRRLAALLHTRMEVESAPGIGTTFRFRLPTG